MAEYYPLLAKAIGSLPNSTLETRRVVYERARKALIGQLRTLHPPVPDEDIEKESVALDRAVERLEAELASGATPGAPQPAAAPAPPPQPAAPTSRPAAGPPAVPASPPYPGLTPTAAGAMGPAAKRPVPPLRPRTPPPLTPRRPPTPPVPARSEAPVPAPIEAAPAAAPPVAEPPAATPAEPAATKPAEIEESVAPPAGKRAKPPRGEPQRPIAPQPRKVEGQRKRLWIIPAGIGVVVALVAVAAWKLRDRPEQIARVKPSAEQTQADSGKISDRVGGSESSKPAETPSDEQAGKETPAPQAGAPAETQNPATAAPTQQATPPQNNPELPVAHRAALLVEAPDEPNKVKTFLGNVVWKLNNAPQGQTDAVGLAVEADVDLPDDKMKAIVTFEKNTDASLPASHTIKVRFIVDPGSFSGNVKQISVPQMRPEASPGGEPLAGVTVPVVQDSFLVGLSPGNAEAANIDLMRKLQWIDIPMLLDSGKIAKLTFEKGDSGQRDLNEAFETWQKQ